MRKGFLPDYVQLPDGQMLYPVIGGHLRNEPFFDALAPSCSADGRKAIIAEAKRRKLRYRTVKVLGRKLRGKLDLNRRPYEPTCWVFVEVKGAK